jgi:hypothetical protein
VQVYGQDDGVKQRSNTATARFGNASSISSADFNRDDRDYNGGSRGYGGGDRMNVLSVVFFFFFFFSLLID